MTKIADLEIVIRLACLTEDRSDAEQRALIRFAWDHDRAHNKNTLTNKLRRLPGDAGLPNPAFMLEDLVSHVIGSRCVSSFPGDKQHEIGTPERWDETWAKWRAGV